MAGCVSFDGNVYHKAPVQASSGGGMTMKSGPVEILVEEELYKCPECGADGGFHVGFRRMEDRRFRVVLVCPSCRFRFIVGEFLVPTGEPRPYDHTMDGASS